MRYTILLLCYICLSETLACTWIGKSDLKELYWDSTFWFKGTIVRRVTPKPYRVKNGYKSCPRIRRNVTLVPDSVMYYPATKFYVKPDSGSNLPMESEWIVLRFFNPSLREFTEPVNEPEDRKVGDRFFIFAHQWRYDSLTGITHIDFVHHSHNQYLDLATTEEIPPLDPIGDTLMSDSSFSQYQLLMRFNQPLRWDERTDLLRQLMKHTAFSKSNLRLFEEIIDKNHPSATPSMRNRLIEEFIEYHREQ